MAQSFAKRANWLDSSSDSSLGDSNWSQASDPVQGTDFQQLLDQLNNSQLHTDTRWGQWLHRWQQAVPLSDWPNDSSTDSPSDPASSSTPPSPNSVGSDLVSSSPDTTLNTASVTQQSQSLPGTNWHHTHWHHSTQPTDHPGILTVSSSGSGFVEGSTVTAHVIDPDGLGSISYQWSSMGTDNLWHTIGTNSASYTLTANEAGKQIDVVATYTDLRGHHDTAADPFTVAAPPASPAPPPPNSPGVLNVSSTNGFNEGATLTANVTDKDSFDAAAVVYTWQEQINSIWQDIATGQSHALGFNDGGNDFRVLANYTDNAGHAESLQSPAMLAVDVDQPGSLKVTSTGGFVKGSTVTAHVTDADGLGSISYQWSSMGTDNLWSPIGTNSASYTLTSNDAGKQIDVVATYTDNQGHPDTAADPFTVAAAPAPPPNSPGVLSVSSTNGFNEGATLTANVTDKDSFDAAAVAYLWQEQQSNGTWQDIGTGQSHTLGFNDGGHDFRVLANYTDNAGHAEALQSQAMLAVDVDRLGSLTVTSPGGFVEGATVTAQVTDPDGVGTVSYQWSSMGTDNLWHPIGTNSASYTLTANEAGKQIDVVATYTDNQGHHDTAADPFTVAAAPPPTSSANGFLFGVNLAGAEFADYQRGVVYPDVTLPGVNGVNYEFPTHAEVDYYHSKGLELIRLPFLWERLEPTLNGPFDPNYLAGIKDITDYATSLGMKVDLCPTNFGQYHGEYIGTADVPDSAFANFWGQLAPIFKDNPNVIFDLMGEPTQSVTQWLPAANDAIAAIRDVGATQEIWIPGNNNTGPAWVGSDNAKILVPGIVDPQHNYAFEIHAYFDPAHAGSSNVISATEGVTELTAVTNWARTNHVSLVLGETGVGTGATDLQALDNTLNFLTQNTDVWKGVGYWAGGPLWNSWGYRLSIEPTGLGTATVVDKPQMTILESYIHPADFMPTS